MKMLRDKWLAFVGLIVVAGILFAACAPEEVVKTVEVTVPPEKVEVTKEVEVVVTATPAPSPTEEEVTLRVWLRDPCQVYEKVLEAYQEQHPNVKFETSCYEYEDVITVWPAAFEAGEPPDIGMPETPYPGMPVYVAAGKIMEITDLVEERGWRDKFVTGLDYWNRFWPGQYYVVPTRVSLRAFYYNKDIMAEIGGTVPQTVAELEELCDKAQASGYTCLGLGNLSGWGSEGYWINLAFNHLANEDWESWIAGILEADPEVRWDRDAMRKGLETFLEWDRKGYFNPDYNAIPENDARWEFLRGDMLAFWHYSEANPDLIEAQAEFEIGFFNMPPVYPNAPILAMTNPSGMWTIPKGTRHPEVAIDVLDFITSPEAGKIYVEEGLITVIAGDYSDVDLPAPWIPEQLDALAEQKLLGWPNFMTPGLGEVTGMEVQKLLAGQATMDEVLAKFQEAYEKGAADQRAERE
jgi:raffinose/stachyose/melibiose transport system substrate-binding protein